MLQGFKKHPQLNQNRNSKHVNPNKDFMNIHVLIQDSSNIVSSPTEEIDVILQLSIKRELLCSLQNCDYSSPTKGNLYCANETM